MSQQKLSYKLSNLPPNIMISPKYLLDWWDGVIARCGAKMALQSKEPDFKLGRELWVAAVFACCKRLVNKQEHWVSRIADTAPDAWVAYFEKDETGYGRHIYQIEVTTYGSDKSILEDVLKAKLDKAYTQDTRIVCYITKIDKTATIDPVKLEKFVSKNNPSNYEVWLLSSFEPKVSKSKDSLKLYCLTANEDYQINLAVEKLIPNRHEAWFVPDQKATNKTGKLSLKGKL